MLVTCMWPTLKVSCMYVTRIMYRDWLESNTNSHSNIRLSVFFSSFAFFLLNYLKTTTTTTTCKYENTMGTWGFCKSPLCKHLFCPSQVSTTPHTALRQNGCLWLAQCGLLQKPQAPSVEHPPTMDFYTLMRNHWIWLVRSENLLYCFWSFFLWNLSRDILVYCGVLLCSKKIFSHYYGHKTTRKRIDLKMPRHSFGQKYFQWL